MSILRNFQVPNFNKETYGPDARNWMPSPDLARIRQLFFVTTLEMVASRPLFGVGVGGYYLRSAQFSPRELLEIYPRENAHNYFLQIAGELGLVGLAVFLWLLCAALWSVWPGASTIRRDPLGFGLFAGVTAFLLTYLSIPSRVAREVREVAMATCPS